MNSALIATVLVIVADDLGHDQLARIETPNIDRLAAQGVTFTSCWSSPICTPSRGMLLTGRFPTRTGLGTNVDWKPWDLPDSELTIAELVDQAHGFGKYHVSMRARHPLEQGFDYYAGARSNVPDYYHWSKNQNGVFVDWDVHATVDTVNEAIAHPASFMYVSFNAPHKPIHRPPGASESSYPAVVRHMDAEIGRLLEAYPGALVIFVADNGSHRDFGGGKGLMLESGINVPLIVAGPGVVHGQCDALVNLTDIYATVAELRGFTSSAEDSISLVPYLRDPDRPSLRTYNYSEHFVPNGAVDELAKWKWNRAVRNRRYKLIRTKTGLDWGERFYDLLEDPREEHPIQAQGPDYEELSQVMESWFD